MKLVSEGVIRSMFDTNEDSVLRLAIDRVVVFNAAGADAFTLQLHSYNHSAYGLALLGQPATCTVAAHSRQYSVEPQ